MKSIRNFIQKRLQIDGLRQRYAAEIFCSIDFQVQQIGHKRSVVYIENFSMKPKGNLLLGSVKDVIKISQKFGQKKQSSKIKQMVLCGLNSAIQVQQIGHKRSVVYIENFSMKPKGNPLLGSVKDVIKISQKFGSKKHSSKIKQMVLCGWNSAMYLSSQR